MEEENAARTREEQAEADSRVCCRELLSSRIGLALARASKNPAYRDICCQQEESARKAEAILSSLEKEKRLVIRRHYEGETEKENQELLEAYLQGMRDCLYILGVLDVFSRRAGY